jgi:hypothetical protein
MNDQHLSDTKTSTLSTAAVEPIPDRLQRWIDCQPDEYARNVVKFAEWLQSTSKTPLNHVVDAF